MNVLGIIAEYNPLHLGHFQHMQQAKAAAGCSQVVVVLSGNFVQRGEPAILDKWLRTRMALEAGADMVLELPLYYATASAGSFAYGGVTLLERTGVVDALCFGSECGTLPPLAAAAELLSQESDGFKTRLREGLGQGASFPAARAQAMAAGGMPGLSAPNDTLGVEYLRALRRLGSRITPFTLPRQRFLLNAAKDVRRALLAGETEAALESAPSALRPLVAGALATHGPATLDNLSDAFQYMLRTVPATQLGEIWDVAEGLEHRFLAASSHAKLSDVLAAVKTKRYTYTRVQRAALHMLLGITHAAFMACEAAGGPQYIRVLGFRRAAAPLLGEMARRATLPVVTNVANHALPPGSLAAHMLAEEARATGIYAMAFPQKNGRRRILNEYRQPLVVV